MFGALPMYDRPPQTREEALEYVEYLQDKFNLLKPPRNDYRAKIEERKETFQALFVDMGLLRGKVIFTMTDGELEFEVKRLRSPAGLAEPTQCLIPVTVIDSYAEK